MLQSFKRLQDLVRHTCTCSVYRSAWAYSAFVRVSWGTVQCRSIKGHTSIHVHVHKYKHAYLHTYLPSVPHCIYPFTNPSVHPSFHPSIRSSTHHLSIQPQSNSFHSFVHSLQHPSIHRSNRKSIIIFIIINRRFSVKGWSFTYLGRAISDKRAFTSLRLPFPPSLISSTSTYAGAPSFLHPIPSIPYTPIPFIYSHPGYFYSDS